MPAAPRSTTISGVPWRPGRRASSRLRCASSFESVPRPAGSVSPAARRSGATLATARGTDPYTPIQERGAFAVRFEGKLVWDNVKGENSDNREANKLVRPLFRKGREIKL